MVVVGLDSLPLDEHVTLRLRPDPDVVLVKYGFRCLDTFPFHDPQHLKEGAPEPFRVSDRYDGHSFVVHLLDLLLDQQSIQRLDNHHLHFRTR